MKALEISRTHWHKTRDLHEVAYADVCNYIEQFIIEKKQSQLLQYLTDVYNEIFGKLHNKEFGVSSVKYTSRQLFEKLQNTYADRIQIIILPREGCVIDEDTYSRLEED